LSQAFRCKSSGEQRAIEARSEKWIQKRLQIAQRGEDLGLFMGEEELKADCRGG
jgi:hypothetical protein